MRLVVAVSQNQGIESKDSVLALIDSVIRVSAWQAL